MKQRNGKDNSHIRIGVLALQGSVIEHVAMLEKIKQIDKYYDMEILLVKQACDLMRINGIILPGGESTVMGKLLKDFDLYDILKRRIEDGLPVFGTCAGMILLAKEVIEENPHLAVMNIRVRRNAFGRQIDSFCTEAIISKISLVKIPLVFIRAPWIEAVGKGQTAKSSETLVETLCKVNGYIVAARQGNMLVTSFHPELTDDTRVHEYFLKIVVDSICCV